VIAWLRILAGLGVVALVTPVLFAWQVVAVALGGNGSGATRLWHRMVIRLLGYRIHVHGQMSAKRPLLIVANHISWTDIMVMGSIADVYFISKSELAGWPIIGYLARWQRTIFVERERKGKSAEQAGEIGQRLAKGDPMVLFAEGTTHDGNRIAPFKSSLFGAASIAIATGEVETVHIQPVAIAYTRLHGMPMGRQHRSHVAWIGDSTLVPHIKDLLGEGGIDVEVHFGEPIEFGPGASRKAIAAEVERQVRAMMVAALADPKK